MRRLRKTAKPSILLRKGTDWRDELIAVLALGDKPTKAMKDRYRHPEIKAAIINETHGKCAYCESKVTHITYGDIEHIIPKSKVPAKSYEWDNLTLACDICNGNKGDHYSDDPISSQDSLVDPYNDDPRDHFLFLREVVSPRPDSMRAFETEKVIKLSRGELLERRRERMDFLDGLIRAYKSADAKYKPILLDDLKNNHLGDTSEYAASSAAYIDHLHSIGVL